MKETMVFVDHSFHKKTKSGDFLRELFGEKYEIVDLYDDSWRGINNLNAETINKYNPDLVFFFQSLLSFEELEKIKSKIVWAPMYDSVVSLPSLFWRKLSCAPILIITFCLSLDKKINNYGLKSFYIQYYMDPKKLPKTDELNNNRLFFWQRTNFSFIELKRYLDFKQINGISLKLDVDPNHKAMLPTTSDIKKYKIKFLEFVADKNSYLKEIGKCGLFVAPREFEGIGMSFIEAMAMGLVVIAMDNPTMSEYIKNGYNGYLFNLTNKKRVNLKNIELVRRNLRHDYLKKFKLWEKNKMEMLNFIEDNRPKSKNISQRMMMVYKFISNIELVIYYLGRLRFVLLRRFNQIT